MVRRHDAREPRILVGLDRLGHVHIALVDEHLIEHWGLTDDVLRCALAWVGCAEEAGWIAQRVEGGSMMQRTRKWT